MRIRDVAEEHEVLLKPTGAAPASAASARGRGEWKLYRDGTRKCKASVTHLSLPEETRLHLSINGRHAGEMAVQRGTARFRRESENGDFVPAVQVDEVLQIILEGTVILEGKFYLE